MRTIAGLGVAWVLLVGCSSSDSKSNTEPCNDCSGGGATGTGTRTAAQGGSGVGTSGTHSTQASRGGSGPSTSSGGTSNGSQSTGGKPNFLVADPNDQTPRSLQIAAGTLFWISGMGQIVKAPTSGGTAVTLYTQSTGDSGTIEIGALAVDSSNVYYTNCGNKSAERGLYRLGEGSAAPTRLIAGTLPTSVALQGNDICFEDAGAIRCIKKDGATANTVANGVYNRQPTLIVRDGYVYFHAAFNYSDPEHVYRARVSDDILGTAGAAGAAGAPNAGTTKAERISIVPGRAMILLAPTFDADYVYWAAGDSIYRWSPAGGAATEVSITAIGTEAMTAPAPHEVLYVTDGFMYWLSSGMMSGGKMFKQAVENGTRTQFMSGGITSIVSDPNALYGISGKEILRVNK